jgi:uncharacterized alkaline shock family protein YloU
MEHKLGTVRIAPNVLATTARLTALSVPGIASMAEGPSLMARYWMHDGVRVDVKQDAVSLDLYVVVEPEINMLTVSRQVQSEVARAIHDIVGMPVREINVHILDVA